MPIKIRKRKNLKRGTEISYATIPINEIDGITEEEIDDVLDKVWELGPKAAWEKGARANAHYITLGGDNLEYSSPNHNANVLLLLKDFVRIPDKERLVYLNLFGNKEREKLKINLRGILDSSESGLKRGKEIAKRKYTKIRYVRENYSNPSSTWIYGDKLAFVIWIKGHSFAIRMTSKEIVNNFKKHFEILWKNSK